MAARCSRLLIEHNRSPGARPFYDERVERLPAEQQAGIIERYYDPSLVRPAHPFAPSRVRTLAAGGILGRTTPPCLAPMYDRSSGEAASPLECANPVGLTTLLAYWLGELDEARERGIEEHFQGCAACSAELAELASLAEEIRSCGRHGALRAVVTPAFVDRLVASGLQLQQHALDRQGSMTCRAGRDEDLVVARLRAPLASVRRIDLVLLRVESGGEERIDDVPFEAAADEVIVIPRTSVSRTMPTFTSRVRALAVDASGERVLGDYTLNQTPWPAV